MMLTWTNWSHKAATLCNPKEFVMRHSMKYKSICRRPHRQSSAPTDSKLEALSKMSSRHYPIIVTRGSVYSTWWEYLSEIIAQSVVPPTKLFTTHKLQCKCWEEKVPLHSLWQVVRSLAKCLVASQDSKNLWQQLKSSKLKLWSTVLLASVLPDTTESLKAYCFSI